MHFAWCWLGMVDSSVRQWLGLHNRTVHGSRRLRFPIQCPLCGVCYACHPSVARWLGMAMSPPSLIVYRTSVSLCLFSLRLSLSLCVCVCCVCVCLSCSASPSVPISFYLSLSVSPSLCVSPPSLFLGLSLYLSPSLSVSLSLFLSLSFSMHLHQGSKPLVTSHLDHFLQLPIRQSAYCVYSTDHDGRDLSDLTSILYREESPGVRGPTVSPEIHYYRFTDISSRQGSNPIAEGFLWSGLYFQSLWITLIYSSQSRKNETEWRCERSREHMLAWLGGWFNVASTTLPRQQVRSSRVIGYRTCVWSVRL